MGIGPITTLDSPHPQLSLSIQTEARPPRGITKQFIDYAREHQPKRMKYSQELVGSPRHWKSLPALG